MTNLDDWIRHILNGTGQRVYVNNLFDEEGIEHDQVRQKLHAWCNDNCSGPFYIGLNFGVFKLKQDAVLFKLRWHG